ncbi:class I SAM-dependent methyltransferase (plasmid) [Burkholderia sp. FERM BP-3421]|nr:class I SAM-dependent methyltransferase [Burkholderia sp. FERM BP-3421]
MLLSDRLLQPAERRLADLPLPCALRLPGGRQIGAAQPQLVFTVRDWRALLHVSRGAIGHMRDLMAIAPVLLGTDPTREAGRWFARLLQRAQLGIWERTHHSWGRDAVQVQRHYDVSDDFYARWRIR